MIETEIVTTRLIECERVIERGLNTFVEVGTALLEIRDNRLYKDGYSTFEEYCRERWDMQRAYAYRLIGAAEVVANLSPIGDILPATETQARPLASLSPDVQLKAWQEVLDIAPDGKVTAALVEKVVEGYKEPENIETPSLPEGKFSVIYADPPWPVGSIVMDKWESPIEDKYPTMELSDIASLPVVDKAANDCSLFLWTTHTFLPDALEIIEAWKIVPAG